LKPAEEKFERIEREREEKEGEKRGRGPTF
jgi:hypothetical protein